MLQQKLHDAIVELADKEDDNAAAKTDADTWKKRYDNSREENKSLHFRLDVFEQNLPNYLASMRK